jgi:hypothetical protein
MKRRARAVTAVLLSTGALIAAASAAAPAHAQATGQWQYTGSFANGHGAVPLVQLPDGRVLAAGGGNTSGAISASAEIYTPATGLWTSAGSLSIARAGFGRPSVLPDGRVLVATGDVADSIETSTAEIYSPVTNSWSLTGSLSQGRRSDVQVALADGRVLVADGAAGGPTCGRFLSSAEIYDPATGSWSPAASTLDARESGTGIRLADGRVLLAGGYGCGDPIEPAMTELYDPATGDWSRSGDLPVGRVGGTLVMLADHRVLMFGGHNDQIAGVQTEAAIFDPATGQWTQVASLNLPRENAAATLLPSGKVLVSQGGPLQSEIYDPVANAWALDATTLDKNDSGGTFLLPTGEVLLAGGSTDVNGIPSVTAELYAPASPAGTYVALGDSYSAGVGSGGASIGGKCLRNSNAYPALRSASHPADKFTFAACSGATTGDVQSTQLTAITAGATLITITAGGDPAFVPYILACSVPTPQGDQACTAATVIAQAAIKLVTEPSLKGLYAAIRARAASVGSPEAQLVVLGYPDFFPDNLLCQTSDSFEQSEVNQTIDALDTAIAHAANATTGTTFLDVRPAFAAHELCTQDPWLNGINPSNLVNSFHPNQAGQAQGYEAALTAITG